MRARRLGRAAGALVLVAAVSGAVRLVARGSPSVPKKAPTTTPQVSSAVVERVVDGDTIVLEGGERVRLIGVDTPELHHPSKPVGCFAQAASEFTSRGLAGRRVSLERDVAERDRYGRLLAYVWTGPPGEREADVRAGLFNARLVAEGYAQVLTVPPDVRYADLLVRLEREARSAGRGLWGACRP